MSVTNRFNHLYQQFINSQISKAEAFAALKRISYNTNKLDRVFEADEHPLSETQRAIWIASQQSPDNYAYNVPYAFLPDQFS